MKITLEQALLMFQSEELSAGAAAELAEVDRFTFAAECHKHGIPLVDYPVEDLRAKLAGLRWGVSSREVTRGLAAG